MAGMIVTDTDNLRRPNRKLDEGEAAGVIRRLKHEFAPFADRGVGLAAPQIGEHVRAAILRVGRYAVDLVNPIIKDRGRMILSRDEGCLSLPGIKKNVWRHEEILVVDSINPNGIVMTGFLAIVAQHEIDHLDGILITDRAVDAKVGRNAACPCGAMKDNGKPVKFKNCHGRR